MLKVKDSDGNTVLHLLSMGPTTTYFSSTANTNSVGYLAQPTMTTDEKMNMMFGFLFRGAIPNQKNNANLTFIQAYPRIKPKICTRILESSAKWIKVQWNIIECWISLGEDEILKTLFKNLVTFHEVQNYLYDKKLVINFTLFTSL